MLNTRSTMQLWSKSHDARHRIWSLQDVFKANMEDYVFITKTLAEIKSYAVNIHDRETADTAIKLICDCNIKLTDLGAFDDRTLDFYFRKCLTFLEADNYTEAIGMIGQLHHIVDTFFERALIVRINDNALAYFEQEKLFGDAVYNKFPKARLDIKEAGTCYVFDRFTACVLHTMRAIEIATKRITCRKSIKVALFKRFGKGHKDSEFSSNDGLGQKAKKLHAAADHLKGTKQDKMRSAAMHLKIIASALRNPTMHTNVEFSERQAKLTMDNTRELMNDLCLV